MKGSWVRPGDSSGRGTCHCHASRVGSSRSIATTRWPLPNSAVLWPSSGNRSDSGWRRVHTLALRWAVASGPVSGSGIASEPSTRLAADCTGDWINGPSLRLHGPSSGGVPASQRSQLGSIPAPIPGRCRSAQAALRSARSSASCRARFASVVRSGCQTSGWASSMGIGPRRLRATSRKPSGSDRANRSSCRVARPMRRVPRLPIEMVRSGKISDPCRVSSQSCNCWAAAAGFSPARREICISESTSW